MEYRAAYITREEVIHHLAARRQERNPCEGLVNVMPKHIIILSENDIAKIINGEEVSTEIKGEKVIICQSYLKDVAVDLLNRPNQVVNRSTMRMGY